MSESSTPTTPTTSSQPSSSTESSQTSQETQSSKQSESKIVPKKYYDIAGERIDEDTFKREREKAKGADKALREAAQLRKQYEDFQKRLSEDPSSLLSDNSIPKEKRRQLAEKWFLENMDNMNDEPEDPRDIENKKIKEELDRYKQQEAEAKKAEEEAQYQVLVEQRKEAIAGKLGEVMKKSVLSKDPSYAANALRDAALYMRLARDAGYDAPVEEIVDHIEQRYRANHKYLTESLDGEDLLNFLGPDILKKLRKIDLERLSKSRQQPAPQQAERWESRSSDKPREFVDPHELMGRR